MSGIITGPYFRQYFKYPGAVEIGTIVAVLEIGALSWHCPLLHLSELRLMISPSPSHVPCIWPSGRLDWPTRDALRRSDHLLRWRARPNLHDWLLDYGDRPHTERFRRRFAIARSALFACPLCVLLNPPLGSRTIVPIYQSEISPPNHVRRHDSSPYTHLSG